MKPPNYELGQFLGGYFHQDWRILEGKEWSDVVDKFAKEATPDYRAKVAIQLRELLAATPSDEALEHRVFWELGCYYYPPGGVDPMSYREWLSAVAAQLTGAGIGGGAA